MKTLVEFIRETKSHLRDLYLKINEDLGKIITDKDGHSNFRKNGLDDPNYKVSNNIGGIPNSKIRKIFNIIDHIIVDNLEIKKLSVKDKVGIVLQEDKDSIMIICKILSFNEDNKLYDILLKTVGRRNYFQTVNNVKLSITIKGKYKQVRWDV